MLLLLCLFADPAIHGACIYSDMGSRFTCHFFHGNFFHFLANACCLWMIRPSVSDMAKAYPLAVVATLFTTMPTVGISGIVYAHLGMNMCRYRITFADWAVFIMANVATLFIPSIAWPVHFAAFFLGLSVYIVSFILKDR